MAERNQLYQDFLLDQLIRLESVLAAQLLDVMDTTRLKVELRDRLCSFGTSNYLWNKLVNARLVFPVNSPLELVLFPVKAENGLALTSEELQTDFVLGAYRKFLVNSDPIIRTVQANDFSTIVGCASPADNEAELLRVRRFPWLIIPTVPREEIILSRRFTHRVNQGRNKIMQEISEFYMDLYLGIAPLDVEVERFWLQTTTVVLNAAQGQPSYAQQVATAIAANEHVDQFRKPRGYPTRELLDYFGISSERVRNFVSQANDVIIPNAHPQVDPKLTVHLDKPQTVLVNAWLANNPQLLNLAPKEKKKKQRAPIYFLGNEAKALLEEIEDNDIHPLHANAAMIRSFLGNFNDERYQRLAVRMFKSYEPTDEN